MDLECKFRYITLPNSTPQIDTNILPGQEAKLECGSWQQAFGKGLDFEITRSVGEHRRTTEEDFKSEELIFSESGWVAHVGSNFVGLS
jgi:hypothetical protein